MDPSAEGEALLEALRKDTLEGLPDTIRTRFEEIGLAEMRALTTRSSSDDPKEAEGWSRVLEAVMAETRHRLELARTKLTELLACGEINVMDREIVKLVKAGGADEAFMTVLNQNLAAANAGEGEAEMLRANIYLHIATRVQEEIEKMLPPERGLLHRVLRTEDSALRGRILSHYLSPQGSITTPDGESIPLESPRPALADPLEFSQAISEFVAQLRTLDLDGDMIVESIEKCRSIAKEARQIIQQDPSYSDKDLDDYTNSLTPTFQGGSPPATKSP